MTEQASTAASEKPTGKGSPFKGDLTKGPIMPTLLMFSVPTLLANVQGELLRQPRLIKFTPGQREQAQGDEHGDHRDGDRHQFGGIREVPAAPARSATRSARAERWR